MNHGKIVFDCGLTLKVTQLFMQRGMINLHAEGRVTDIPAGVVPYAIYGDDEALVAVGRCDWDKLITVRPRKGDTLVVALALTIESMIGVMS